MMEAEEEMGSEIPNQVAIVRHEKQVVDVSKHAMDSYALAVLDKEKLIAETVKSFSSMFGGRAEDLCDLAMSSTTSSFSLCPLKLKRARMQHSMRQA